MKLGITGSRSNATFDFTALFTRQVVEFNAFLGRRRITTVITGGARGIDKQADICAGSLNIPCRTILPDYAKYRRGAPLKRNLQIIRECDALLVIWNGDIRSRGTIYTANQALRSGKPVFLIVSAGESIQHCIGEIRESTVWRSLQPLVPDMLSVSVI